MQSNWYMIENRADIQAALKEKREQVEENQPVWYSQKYNAEEPDMHLILDLAGMMPAVGAVFDGINATWYLAEGDYTNAALSGMALIPVVGEFAGAGKAGLKGLKCADDIVDAVKALDNTKVVDDMADTAKCLDNVIENGINSIDDIFIVGKNAFDNFDINNAYVKPKHLSTTGGNGQKFIGASKSEAESILKDVLSNGNIISITDNGLTKAGHASFEIIIDAGKTVGTKGENLVKIVISSDGGMLSAYPIK